MKKIVYVLMLLASVVAFSSCDNTETYADQKADERAAISAYIAEAGIHVISESELKSRLADTTYVKDGKVLKMLTDTTTGKNEYVLFSTSGVYMQIVDLGVGTPLKSGTT